MEKTLETKTIYEGKVLKVNVDKVLTEDDVLTIREYMIHPGGACIALKDTDNKYFMVKQYRYAQKEDMLEFCAGKKEINEDPLETIKRETEEELGYTAKNIKYLGYIVPSCAVLTERIYLYSGEVDKQVKQHFDEDEKIDVYKYSLEEIKEFIKEGIITDAKTIALVYKINEQ